VFIINLIPLHVFVLLLMGRFSNRIYTAYTTFFILGLVLSMQIPFVGRFIFKRKISLIPDYKRLFGSWTGFQPVRTSEHMASLGVFALLNAVAILRYLQSKLSSSEIKYVFTIGVLIAGAAVFCVVVLLTYAGVIAPWSGRYKFKAFCY
jgi:dolichyl-diphosphooligosaccharide--protein glycosyltransferase